MNEELEELMHPQCNYNCGASYKDYEDPTGIYAHGKVTEILVDPRADMYINRLLAYINDLKMEHVNGFYNPRSEV